MISNNTNKVKEIISNHKSGWVFSHVDFSELGNVSTIERSVWVREVVADILQKVS